jgi:predicted nucleic acid-binding protein
LKVVVDTPIWSLALRRQSHHLSAVENRRKVAFSELIKDGRVLMVGPVRQELLSGIREEPQFKRLRELLRAFPDHGLSVDYYELAAEMANLCRTRGVANTPTDMLICSVASISKSQIFTTDKDFDRYATFLPISVYAKGV